MRFDFTLLYGFPPPNQFSLRFRVNAVNSVIFIEPAARDTIEMFMLMYWLELNYISSTHKRSKPIKCSELKEGTNHFGFLWVLRFGGSTHKTSSQRMNQSHWLSIGAEDLAGAPLEIKFVEESN